MTHKRIKIKKRQTNKRPISIEQFVALNVYTKQQERNEHSEIIKWRNRMWVRTPRITRNLPGRTLAAITHFPLLCAFPPRQSKNPPLQHPFSRISISPQNLNLFQKGKCPIFFLHFLHFCHFFYLYSPPKNSIWWRKSTFLSSISLHFRKSERFSLSK